MLSRSFTACGQRKEKIHVDHLRSAQGGIVVVLIWQLFLLSVVMDFNYSSHADSPTYFFCWAWVCELCLNLGYYMILLLVAATVTAQDAGNTMHTVDYLVNKEHSVEAHDDTF
jgi:hypothetical protein